MNRGSRGPFLPTIGTQPQSATTCVVSQNSEMPKTIAIVQDSVDAFRAISRGQAIWTPGNNPAYHDRSKSLHVTNERHAGSQSRNSHQG